MNVYKSKIKQFSPFVSFMFQSTIVQFCRNGAATFLVFSVLWGVNVPCSTTKHGTPVDRKHGLLIRSPMLCDQALALPINIMADFVVVMNNIATR